MKRYAFWLKTLAFALAVVMLVGMAACGLGVLLAENYGMYSQSDYDTWLYERNNMWTSTLADQVLLDYGAQLSDCPQWLLGETGYLDAIERAENWFHLDHDAWCYTIQKSDGTLLRDTRPEDFAADAPAYTYVADARYPVMAQNNETEATLSAETETDATYTEYVENFWNPETDEFINISYAEIPALTVTIWLNKSVGNPYLVGIPDTMFQSLFALRYLLIAIIGVCLCLFVAAFVYLMYAAGRNPKTGTVVPKGLNRLPLDLYAGIAALILIFGVAAIDAGLNIVGSGSYNVLLTVLMTCGGLVMAAAAMGFFTALAAQVKLSGHYWWHHSVIGRLWKWVWKAIRFVCRGIVRLLGLLPVIWEWLLIGAVLGIGMIITFAASMDMGLPILVLWWCGIGVVAVGYGGYCFGTIRKGIRRMKEGSLNEKINTQYMIGSFQSVAQDLNTLSDAVAVAAEKQLKSERMKTELITNVSHDIKTPLTSLINYVDLLQQPHTEQEGEQYLEVLSRQSQRLKKLVEDLMDMSKASTGNMAVNAVCMDAVEAVNQALGEFADKLENAHLTPIFHSQMPQMPIIADGRLTWRVLSNLLSNVVKYALPGTRVYCDLRQGSGFVVLSMKNISREELNISADELTERFVRGDTSRNTEGSGLGLNIAQSLMTLQRGSLNIIVDGDLFKVTLTFPTE